MSTTVDNRIVEMSFDNRDFEKHVAESMKTLDNLDKALEFKDAEKSFSSLTNAAKKVDFSSIGDSIDKVGGKFSILENIGEGFLKSFGARLERAAHDISQIFTGIFTGISSRATQAITEMTSGSFFAGWTKFEDKAQAMRTIMSATVDDFVDEGEQIDYINHKLDDLMWYADETSYSFTDMTNNIGKFTAQKIDLDTAQRAMIGISNWAAISGQDTNAASRAMYNLSQSLGTGAVQAIDWKSIVNANMATAQFKELAMEVAAEKGMLQRVSEGVYKTNEGNEVTAASFAERLTKDKWFNNDVLMEVLGRYGEATEIMRDTLNNFGGEFYARDLIEWVDAYAEATGDAAAQNELLDSVSKETGMSVEELKERFDALTSEENALGLAAFKAAQEATTLSQAIDATKDAASSRWMQIFSALTGDFLQQKAFWTEVTDQFYDLFVAPLDSITEFFNGNDALGIIGFNERIGASLDEIPMHADVILKVGEIVVEFFTQMREGLSNLLGIGDPIQAAVNAVVQLHSAVSTVLEKLQDSKIIYNIFHGIREVVVLVANVVRVAFSIAVKGFQVIWPFIQLVIGGVAKLAEWIIFFIRQFNIFTRVPLLLNNITKAFDPIIGKAKAFANEIQTRIGRAIEIIGPKLQAIGDYISDKFSKVWEKLTNLFSGKVSPIFSKIGSVINKLMVNLLKLGSSANLTAFADKFSEKWAKIKDTLSQVGQYISGTFQKVWIELGKTWDVVKEPLIKLWDSIKGIFGTIGNKAGGFLSKIFPKKDTDDAEASVSILDRIKTRFSNLNLMNQNSSLGEWFQKLRNWLTDVDGPFQKFTDKVSELKAKLTDKWENGGGKETFTGVLEKIKNAFEKIKEFGKGAWENIKEFFSAFAGSDDGSGDDVMTRGATNLEDKADKINVFATALKVLGTVISVVVNIFKNVVRYILDTLGGEGASVSDIFKNFSTSAFLLGVKHLFDGISGFLDTLSDVTEKVKLGGLNDLSSKIKRVLDSVADVLKWFAISLGVFVLAVVVLSHYSYDDIGKVFLAIGGFMMLLFVFIKIIEARNISTRSMTKLQSVGKALAPIAAAIWAMAKTVAKLGKLKPEQMEQGMKGLLGIVLMVAGIMFVLSDKSLVTGGGTAVSTSMNGQIKGMISVAAACYILALTVGKLAKIAATYPDSYETAIWSLIGIMGALAVLILVMKESGKEDGVKNGNLAKMGLAFIELAAALAIISVAIGALALLPRDKLIRGAATVGALIVLLGLFAFATKKLKIDGKNLAILGFGMIEIALAMGMLVPVITTLGFLPFGKVAKGLGILAAALLIFLGAAALAGLELVSKGLKALTLTMVGFGAAIFLVGLGFDLFGKGMVALAAGLALMVVVGQPGILAFINVLGLLLDGLITLIPKFALFGANLVIAFIEALISMGERLLNAVVRLFTIILDAGTQMMEPIKVFIETFLTALLEICSVFLTSLIQLLDDQVEPLKTLIIDLLDAIIDIIFEALSKLLTRLIAFLVSSLATIAEYTDDFVAAAADIIIALMKGIQEKGPELIAEAINTVTAIVQGLADAFDPAKKDHNEVGNLLKAIDNLLMAIIRAIGAWFGDIFKKGVDLVAELWAGITGQDPEEVKADAHNLINKIIDGIIEWISDFWNAGKKLAKKIWDGLTGWFKEKDVNDVGKELGNDLVNGVNDAAGVHSPSKEMEWTGEMLTAGLTKGIYKTHGQVVKSANELSGVFTDSFGGVSNIIRGLFGELFGENSDPVIRPTLDLTEIISGTNSISDLFNEQQGIKLSGIFGGGSSDDLLSGGENTNTSGVTFIQNNYSPKELSRLEIYRQTQNQLSMFKGVMNGT